jgi:phosphate transport system permease protein
MLSRRVTMLIDDRTDGLPEDDQPRAVRVTRTTGDRVFRAMAVGSGMTVLLAVGLILVFLTARGWPVLRHNGLGFITRQAERGPNYGIQGALFNTIKIGVIALVIATPISVATAIFINEYAHARVRGLLRGLIDLLAALPSIVYGLWGLLYLGPKMGGLARWIGTHLAFLPFFRGDVEIKPERSPFVAGVVVAIMCIPIITSVSREVLSQVPRDQCEAAYALGGTRWAMIREVVLPFGRSGIIGGAMLGLGRAMGETIAVLIIVSSTYQVTSNVLQPGGGTVASLIALKFGDANASDREFLAAASLLLFIMTLIVNMIARFIVNRAKNQKGLDL